MAVSRRPDSPALRIVPSEGDLPPEPDADPRERIVTPVTDADLPWRFRAVGGSFRLSLMTAKPLPPVIRTSSRCRPHRVDNTGSY